MTIYILYFFVLNDWTIFILVGCVENNIDYPGEDLSTIGSKTIQECIGNCTEDKRCQFWTLEKNRNLCYLKKEGAINKRVPKNDVISGTKFCPGKHGKRIVQSYNSCIVKILKT